MKNTALTEKHISLGAKMVPFAGYNMPVSYSGLNDEHATILLKKENKGSHIIHI